MTRTFNSTIVHVRITENPVLTNGTLLRDEYVRLPGVTEQDHKELVELLHSIVFDHQVTWYNSEETVKEANTGASGIGSEIVFFLTNNFPAVAQGLVGNAIFLAIISWYNKRKKNSVELKTISIDYVANANKHIDKIKLLSNEKDLEVFNIRQFRENVRYDIRSDKCIYEIEETPLGIKYKRIELMSENLFNK